MLKSGMRVLLVDDTLMYDAYGEDHLSSVPLDVIPYAVELGIMMETALGSVRNVYENL